MLKPHFSEHLRRECLLAAKLQSEKYGWLQGLSPPLADYCAQNHHLRVVRFRYLRKMVSAEKAERLLPIRVQHQELCRRVFHTNWGYDEIGSDDFDLRLV